MDNKFGLSTQNLDIMRKIFTNYMQIDSVKIYGSRAKGNYRVNSDVDLVVYGDNIDRFVIADVLMQLNETDIPYMFDLQHYNSIKNHKLREHIDRVGVVIYTKKF